MRTLAVVYSALQGIPLAGSDVTIGNLNLAPWLMNQWWLIVTLVNIKSSQTDRGVCLTIVYEYHTWGTQASIWTWRVVSRLCVCVCSSVLVHGDCAICGAWFSDIIFCFLFCFIFSASRKNNKIHDVLPQKPYNFVWTNLESKIPHVASPLVHGSEATSVHVSITTHTIRNDNWGGHSIKIWGPKIS